MMEKSGKKYPLISIIIPVFNAERYLDKCLDSLARQTYKNTEIILVDDGSTDSSYGRCLEFTRLHDNAHVYRKENGGASEARNYGLDRARGAYITFIDSDDYVDDDYIAYLYFLLKKYKTDMSLCQHRVIYSSGKIIDYGKRGRLLLPVKTCIERMLYHDVIDTSLWAKLYDRKLFDHIRFPKDNIFEDLATTYKLMLACDKIACGYRSKYNYVLHDESVSNCTFSDKKLSFIEVTDSMVDDVLRTFPDLQAAGLAKKVRARLSVINLIINSDAAGYEKEKKRFRRYIKKRMIRVLINRKVAKSQKLAVILISISRHLYELVWKHYRKGAV